MKLPPIDTGRLIRSIASVREPGGSLTFTTKAEAERMRRRTPYFRLQRTVVTSPFPEFHAVAPADFSIVAVNGIGDRREVRDGALIRRTDSLMVVTKRPDDFDCHVVSAVFVTD